MMLPGYKYVPLIYSPTADRIIHHKKHSYDEKKNVIVVDDTDEDRQEFINSFKDSVGLKNILKQLQLTGGVLPPGMAYNEETDSIDVSGMPDNVNDLKKAADEGSKVIADAVKQFNDTYGTSYSVDEFIKKYADGTLLSEIAAKLEAEKEKPQEEGE